MFNKKLKEAKLEIKSLKDEIRVLNKKIENYESEIHPKYFGQENKKWQ